MNLITWAQYACARVHTQIRTQAEPFTEEQWVLFRILQQCVDRYRQEGK